MRLSIPPKKRPSRRMVAVALASKKTKFDLDLSQPGQSSSQALLEASWLGILIVSSRERGITSFSTKHYSLPINYLAWDVDCE